MLFFITSIINSYVIKHISMFMQIQFFYLREKQGDVSNNFPVFSDFC